MKTLHTIRFVFILVLVSSLLAGCGFSTPVPWTPVPTMDPATVIAAAVNTMQAQMTEEALLNPSATPEPTQPPAPTDTPAPSATPQPTTPPVPPTATATQPAALSAEVLYTTTYPENKREYVPNERFSLAIGFKNNGTLTWEQGFTVKIVRVDGEITVAPEVTIDKSTAPGEKAEFNLWAFGSETLGKHTWYFQLYNSSGIAVPGGFAVFSYTSY